MIMRIIIGTTVLLAISFWALVALAVYDLFAGTAPFREGEFSQIVSLNATIACIATITALAALFAGRRSKNKKGVQRNKK